MKGQTPSMKTDLVMKGGCHFMTREGTLLGILPFSGLHLTVFAVPILHGFNPNSFIQMREQEHEHTSSCSV
jgi:hypothetical protein